MTHTTGRIGRTLASVTVCAASGIAFADATDWVRGIPGGSDLTLSMTSIDEADGPLRELARAAQIDWLPTASRLLSVTNLSTGADTSRSISFGFVSGDEPRIVRFVAVIPSDRPAMIAANFEALPSTEHAGLFAFEFAGQSYFARVLPDDHLAISNAPSLLLGLREVDGEPLAAPMRLTLTGDGSLATLTSLMAGIRQEESDSENEPEMSMPDGVESITIDLTPSSGSLRADIRIREPICI